MAYGPLRIIRWPAAYAVPTADDQLKQYSQRLALLAPAEVTGFYLTFRPMVVGSLTAEQIPHDYFAPWWPWICAALVIFVRIWATHGARIWEAQWIAVAVSTFAFILWMITMGHYLAYLSEFLPDQRIAGILAAVFTFVVPYFYKGDPPPAPHPAT